MTRHLLHVGYPKAGSTFLQRWFEGHPQLAYVDGGIAGFRDAYSIASDGALQNHSPLYRVTSAEGLVAPRLDSERTVVDYTGLRGFPVFAAQQKVCSTLAGLFPDATVLIITRGFRSMILSSLSQYARSGGELDPGGLVRTIAKERDPNFVQWWDYDSLIGSYRAAFAGRVIVMPYELLRDDAAAFLRTLATALGIDASEAESARVNESLSPVELYWYPRLTRFVRRLPSRRLFNAYIGAALRNRLQRPIAVLQRLRPGEPFTAASIPDEVIEMFRGRAESLRDHPLYARYAAEYLNQ